MTLHEFRDILKRLSFIDQQPWMSEDDWPKFRDDPVRFFIKADAETADRLWAIIAPTPPASDTSALVQKTREAWKDEA